jgi:DHA1 family tetracycline resistance protein-like MFS transporter
MTTVETASEEPRRGSLLVIFLTVFIDLLGFAMVLPLVPIYAEQFGTDESGWTIALLMSSFSIMQFLFAPLWGRLSDRIGRRPVLIIGLLGSTVFYTLFGLASVWKSLTWLFVTRIGAGIAGATIPTAQAYIADTTTLQTRARGMALIGAAFGLGFTFGPLIGALSLHNSQATASPWPGYAAGILSGIATLLAIGLLPESLRPGNKAQHHDWLDLGALRDALATPTIPAILLVSFISVVSFGGFETTLSLLLKSKAFNFELRHVFYYFAYIGLTLTLAQGVLVRRLATRVPERGLASAGAVVSLLGFGLMVWASTAASLALLLVASAVEVVGFALMTPSLQALISRRSDPAKQGGVLGISQSVSALGRILGPIMAIPLFKAAVAYPYLAASGLMLVGLFALLFATRGGGDYSAEAARAKK